MKGGSLKTLEQIFLKMHRRAFVDAVFALTIPSKVLWPPENCTVRTNADEEGPFYLEKGSKHLEQGSSIMSGSGIYESSEMANVLT